MSLVTKNLSGLEPLEDRCVLSTLGLLPVLQPPLPTVELSASLKTEVVTSAFQANVNTAAPALQAEVQTSIGDAGLNAVVGVQSSLLANLAGNVEPQTVADGTRVEGAGNAFLAGSEVAKLHVHSSIGADQQATVIGDTTIETTLPIVGGVGLHGRVSTGDDEAPGGPGSGGGVLPGGSILPGVTLPAGAGSFFDAADSATLNFPRLPEENPPIVNPLLAEQAFLDQDQLRPDVIENDRADPTLARPEARFQVGFDADLGALAEQPYVTPIAGPIAGAVARDAGAAGAGAVGFEVAALERALESFLNRLADLPKVLGREAGGSISMTWFVLSLMVMVTAAELARRRQAVVDNPLAPELRVRSSRG